ncbi:amidase family protein [Steroidobacter sp.]|uniref:amidase family protein n=1 Tax=Steroidobacter sp. TaxID=1978227 RepID=UPI001A43888F|nr:amidase family protein [Steroidobacter sp.]MBL8267835.1 glutamyl-tRNA amidotransferase [Steroidobacter sp.]
MTRIFTASLLLTLLALTAAPAAQAAKVPLHEATIGELGAAMDAGSLTSEKLVRLSLARIAAYDKKGPTLRAVIALDPKAIDIAKTLDAERRRKGPRSALHGIPVLVKDNFDTANLPTTGGSLLLEGSLPPDDAFLVKRLRDAGAVIIGKTNMSEFASGAMRSSLGGLMRNPHDLNRVAGGSSGGSGIAVAATYAPLALGTDTGGSIRSPSNANGVVGLKPTMGALSRDGIIPLALSFDTPGPLTRNVSDIALAMSVLAGVDAADPATAEGEGKYPQGFTGNLDANALKGARIGVVREFLGSDTEVDWVFEAALTTLKEAGAELIDVKLPKWFSARTDFYLAVRDAEFKTQIETYLKTLDPKYPKSLEQLMARARKLNTLRDDGGGPNPDRWWTFRREFEAGSMTDYRYVAVHDNALPLVRQSIEGMLAAERLDAMVYPTASRGTALIAEKGDGTALPAILLANLGGFPDLSVPAGFNSASMPVNISFLGARFSEPRLIALGYSFEQATQARHLPVNTPALAGETITVPESAR